MEEKNYPTEIVKNILSKPNMKKDWKGLTKTEFFKKYGKYDSASEIMKK